MDIGSQALSVFDALFTVRGVLVAVFVTIVVLYLLVYRNGIVLLGSGIVFLLSLSFSDNKYFDNTLIEPLETIRQYSKPTSTALVLILGLRLIFWPRANRARLWSGWMVVFLSFQAYYLLVLGLFNDFSRGFFGIISAVGLCFTFSLGFGKLSMPALSGTAVRDAWVLGGLGFIGANVAQLVGGYGNALPGGRLAGVSGNPQQLAAAAVIFTIVANWTLETSTTLVKKSAAIACMAMLALFVLWSGSRTGAICLVTVHLAYFRLKVGRLALVFVLTAILLLGLTLVFAESAYLVERFRYGDDTRSAVWLRAIDDFARSPVLGMIISDRGSEPMNVVESGYLRALALLGMPGAIATIALMLTILGTAWRSLRIAKSFPEVGPLSNVICATASFIILVSFFEGFIFGLITIFTAFVYSVGSLVACVNDSGEES